MSMEMVEENVVVLILPPSTVSLHVREEGKAAGLFCKPWLESRTRRLKKRKTNGHVRVEHPSDDGPTTNNRPIRRSPFDGQASVDKLAN